MRILNIENVIFEYFFKRLLTKWVKKDFIPNNYKYFINSSEIKDWGECGNLYFKKLNYLKGILQATKDELFELESFDFYQGYVGEKMNNLLRGTNSYMCNDSYIKNISTIEKTLTKFNLKDNVVALRRTDAKIFQKYKINSNFIEHGFLSTSINLSHREDTSVYNKLLRNEAIIILKIPLGSNALYVEEVQEERGRRKEYELLVQKGSIIKIEKNFKILSNRIILGTVIQNLEV